MEATARPDTGEGSSPASEAEPRTDLSAWDALNLLVLTGVAAVLMLYDLGAKPLTPDEATSYFMGWVPWDAFWHSVTTSEANASLFYGVLRIPVSFGSDPFLVRLIPALCGILAIPVLYLLLARLFGRWTAVVGAAALTANAFFVAHAQEVRGNSMAAFFAALATLLFVLAVEKPTAVRLTLYGLAAAAGCYSHFFCTVVIAAHFLSLPLLPTKTLAWRRFLVTYAGIVALCAPLAYFILANDRGQVDWIPDTTAEGILESLYSIAGSGGRLLGVAVGVCVLLAVIRTVVSAVRKRRSKETFALALIVMWALLPLAFGAAISLFKPLFVARYLLPALPGIAAAIAVGVGVLRVGPLIAASGGVIVALSAPQLPDWYALESVDWRDRADIVIENARSDDAVILYAPTIIRPFGFYSGYYSERPDGRVAPPPIYPPIDWLGYSETRFRPNYDAILAKAAAHERVWFVTGYGWDPPRRLEMTRLIEMLEGNCVRVLGFDGPVDLYQDCREN